MPQTILVVDDSPAELQLATRTLQSGGHRIITASDGEEAIAKAVKDQPSVIVLDVVIPKKNGFQVCRQLKTNPETKDIKIVLLTSKSQESDKFWGMRQGADGYLTKPFSPTELQKTIDGLI